MYILKRLKWCKLYYLHFTVYAHMHWHTQDSGYGKKWEKQAQGVPLLHSCSPTLSPPSAQDTGPAPYPGQASSLDPWPDCTPAGGTHVSCPQVRTRWPLRCLGDYKFEILWSYDSFVGHSFILFFPQTLLLRDIPVWYTEEGARNLESTGSTFRPPLCQYMHLLCDHGLMMSLRLSELLLLWLQRGLHGYHLGRALERLAIVSGTGMEQ